MPVGPGQVLEGDGLERPGQGEHALRRLGAGLGVEPGPRHRLDGDPQAPGQLLDPVQLRRGVLVLGQHDPAHGAAPDGQQLEHGAAALDLVAPELAQGLGAWAATRALVAAPVRRALVAARRPALRAHRGSISTTARQAIPSARPSAPRPSARVAFTDTGAPEHRR